MEFEYIESKVEKAIKSFFEHDCFLIEINANERSITHKLAEYLQLEFPEYHVDCEYNRMINEEINETFNQEKKDKDFIKKKLNLNIEDIKSDDTEAKTVYPDIIIHNRKDGKNNLLVIEVKKEASIDKDEKNMKFDIKKIKAYIKQLKYTNGLFIKIASDCDSTIENLV